MGFFDFLRGRKDGAKRLTMASVPRYLNDLKKEDSATITGQIERVYRRISESTELMERGLASLEKTDVPDTNERHRQMVLSNRDSYVRQARVFLREVPEKTGYRDLRQASERFTKALGEFTKSTVRNYYVIQTLLSSRLSEVSKSLRELEKLFKELEGIDTARIRKTDRILEILEEMEEARSRISQLKEQSLRLEKERSGLAEEKESLRLSLKELKESREYGEKMTDEENLSQMAKEMGRVRDRILAFLSPVEKPLKKVPRDKLSTEASEYLEDPMKAVLKDESLTSLKKVKAFLEDSLMTGAIPLDEKTRAKTEERLSRVLEVEKPVKEYKALAGERERLERGLHSSGVDEKETGLLQSLEETEREIRKKEEQASATKREMEEAEKSLSQGIEKVRAGLSGLGTNVLLEA